ncbi:MAG TPA: class I SAM-dependent methyltransferase [Verrucomicrobiae bacterium]|nr:class I SAM-dependent methyltransferase [Verrucomicrobiae bacterium]
MEAKIQGLLDQISGLSADWHHAGTMSDIVLKAIARHTDGLVIEHSAETGSGKTTLLFSHLSQNHEVFAVDDGQSISRVKNSNLFNSKTVTYIEGPSQVTLPRHTFKAKLQIVLIDGPHGYPFPDLEYYYFYPQIVTGGLLLVDDINIPSIQRMFEILKADEMFELLEVVEYTAFFRRTKAPLIDPLGDNWWLQGVNREHYEYAMARSQYAGSSKLSKIGRFIPPGVKKLIPVGWKTVLFRKF